MALHILKLCVGAESVEDLTGWQASQRGRWPAGRAVHVTRMWPKREAEILDGGSLYWVIKGLILCRQRILALEEVDEGDGIARCGLHLDLTVQRTTPAPRRPFQGWRYLSPEEAPADLRLSRAREEALPPGLAEALAAFGVR
jgi:hypothetical protein